MKEKINISEIRESVDLQNEKEVNTVLNKLGLYSTSNSFPISALLFELTSHCNLACKHCYNKSGENNFTPDAMTPEKWIDFSHYLVEHGGVFEVILSGGEPFLLGNKIFDIMDILHDGGTIFYINTNGYLLSTTIIDKLTKYHYHKIQISIDGATPERHDTFRQKKGSWEKAIAGAKAISKTKIPLKIAHCITPDNLYEIDDMCSLAYSIGATDIMVGIISLSGRATENQEILLNENQIQYLNDKIHENSEKYNGRMGVKLSHPVKEGLEKHILKPNSRALIRPNGDIKLDGMLPFVVGNILKDDFADIWERKIKKAWNDPLIIEFINGFNKDDRNYSVMNTYVEDVYI